MIVIYSYWCYWGWWNQWSANMSLSQQMVCFMFKRFWGGNCKWHHPAFCCNIRLAIQDEKDKIYEILTCIYDTSDLAIKPKNYIWDFSIKHVNWQESRGTSTVFFRSKTVRDDALDINPPKNCHRGNIHKKHKQWYVTTRRSDFTKVGAPAKIGINYKNVGHCRYGSCTARKTLVVCKLLWLGNHPRWCWKVYLFASTGTVPLLIVIERHGWNDSLICAASLSVHVLVEHICALFMWRFDWVKPSSSLQEPMCGAKWGVLPEMDSCRDSSHSNHGPRCQRIQKPKCPRSPRRLHPGTGSKPWNLPASELCIVLLKLTKCRSSMANRFGCLHVCWLMLVYILWNCCCNQSLDSTPASMMTMSALWIEYLTCDYPLWLLCAAP